MRKEGRTDSRLYLSLINLSDGVEKCLYLINKRDAAYAFPHKLSSGLSEEMCRGSQIRCGLDGVRAVEPGSPETGSAISQETGLVRFVMDSVNGNCPEIFMARKVVCLPGFPRKVVSCRSGSTHSDLDSHSWLSVIG